jgi:hypothetical protein
MLSEDKKGFVDTLLNPAVIDPRVYLSVTYIEDVARKLGMEYVEGPDERDERIKELEAELAGSRQAYAGY